MHAPEVRPVPPVSAARPASTARPRQGMHQPAPALRAQPAVPAPPALRPADALALQPLVGNHAVGGALAPAGTLPAPGRGVQRVPVKYTPRNETLYNARTPGGQASARQYGGAVAYDMTRSGDTAVTVTVRIQFLNQMRNGVDPDSPTAPPGTPRLGALLGSPTEIPTSDPDNRRAWCENIVTAQVRPWNGRLTFAGEEVNVFRTNTPKRLPVTFRAVAVFGLGDPYDKRIIVHPTSTQADPATGNPIDAGNYYLNQGAYSANEEVIAAHEYGHLLGIDDEYSQSNEMLNSLLHGASPARAPSAMAAVNRQTVERMALAAVLKPLYERLRSTMPAVAAAFRAQRALVKRAMATSARAGVRDDSVRAALEDNLRATSAARVGAQVPGVVAFQTTANFSNVTAANAGVDAGFDTTSLSTQITRAYWAALGAAERATVNIPGLGATTINVQDSVRAMAAPGASQEGSAAGVAASSVGSAGGAAPGGAPATGLPAVAPASGLVGQLMALPDTWAATGSALETGVTAEAFAARMAPLVRSATVAATAPAPPGAVPQQPSGRVSVLYRRAHTLVSTMVTEACRQLSTDLIGTVTLPVLTSHVADLQADIQSEVTRVMNTPPSRVAALGPPDPHMAALVAHMKTTLEADQRAAAGGGRSPLGAGRAAPTQNVTYSVQGLMGSSANTSIRADQFDPMLRQFNRQLTSRWEKDFRAEVR